MKPNKTQFGDPDLITPPMTNTVDAGGHVRINPATAHLTPEEVQMRNTISAKRSIDRGDRPGLLRKAEVEASTKRFLRAGTPFEAKKQVIKIDSQKPA